MNRFFFILLSLFLAIGFTGCANAKYTDNPPYPSNGSPRLVVSGRVSNTANEPLLGIAVSVFGVREADEPDILSYNYAITDAAGQYTIIRYRGHELPTEVTVVATDSAGLYQEQSRICEVTYDSVYINYKDKVKTPYNGFVTADFILTR